MNNIFKRSFDDFYDFLKISGDIFFWISDRITYNGNAINNILHTGMCMSKIP